MEVKGRESTDLGLVLSLVVIHSTPCTGLYVYTNKCQLHVSMHKDIYKIGILICRFNLLYTVIANTADP